MRTNRKVAKAFAGLLMVSTILVGGMASPAQAKDTGWNGTVSPANTKPSFRDTGWNGT